MRLGTILAIDLVMRWKASPPELIWKREFETRLGAALAYAPRVACWLALAAAYVGLMAYLYVPKVALFDLVTPLAGHFAGLGLSAAVALAVGRRVVLILLGGMILTILGHSLPLHLPDRAALAVAPGAQASRGEARGLDVLAFNVWRDNREPDLMIRVIEGSGADVVLLSEVTREIAVYIERLRDTYPFVVYCAGERPCTQMVLSKIPLVDTGTLPAAIDQPAMVWARLGGEGPTAGVTVVSTHLYRPTRGFTRHRRQLEGLIAALDRFKGPLIVGGDLNATPSTRSYTELTLRAGLIGLGRSLPSWPAYPLTLPQFGLDHVLVRGLTLRASGVGPYGGSDHLPVWARLATIHLTESFSLSRNNFSLHAPFHLGRLPAS
jgi:endonuclease/exonuclease/phosphatase (EEP) superfamily protein YafD